MADVDLAAILASSAQLEALLLQVTHHDTAHIAAAEAIIVKILCNSSKVLHSPHLSVSILSAGCVAPLMQQVTSSSRVEVRQLAGVFLRKKIGIHWKKLKADLKSSIKVALLQRCSF